MMKKLLDLGNSDDNLFLPLLLNNKFEKLNIYLSEKQLDDLVQQVSMKNIQSINLGLTKKQLLNTKYSKKEDVIKDVLNNKTENFVENINNDFAKEIQQLADRFAVDRLEVIYKKIPEYFIKLQNGSMSVAHNIDDIWGHSLDLFELLINTAVEITTNFNVETLNNYEENTDLYDALQRLQGRACLISNEILALLRAGFTDGAYARCRTLYDTIIISSFISDKEYGGNETAKRYLDYSIVNDLNEAKRFNQYSKIIEETSLNSNEIEELEEAVNQLKLQYGDSFTKGDYAWAHTLRKSDKHNIKFSELEEKIDFKHMKSFYKSASNNIHTGSSSLYFHRGLHSEDSDKILMGPTSFGIEIPCDLASKLINVITSNLIFYETQTLEQWIQGLLLLKIQKDLSESLVQIEIKV